MLILLDLGPLVPLHGVFDGERVQPELPPDDLELLLVGLLKVYPQVAVLALDDVADRLDVLDDQELVILVA